MQVELILFNRNGQNSKRNIENFLFMNFKSRKKESPFVSELHFLLKAALKYSNSFSFGPGWNWKDPNMMKHWNSFEKALSIHDQMRLYILSNC